MSRGYPMRMSRNVWKIPICSKHNCNKTCEKRAIISENGTEIYQEDNPNYIDGHCEYFNIVEDTFIPLFRYDIKSGQILPHDHNQYDSASSIMNLDEIVIKEQEIYLRVDFPLKTPIKIKLKTKNRVGFTRKKLLDSIKKVYMNIYKKEEETSSPLYYVYTEECFCMNRNIDRYITKIRINKNTLECPICTLILPDIRYKLVCGHLFHKSCIKKWAKIKKNCPICRASMISCQECSGNGIKENIIYCKVVPKEFRNGALRNETNGKYGIYHFDLEDLILSDIYYNRLKKIVSIKIFGLW